MIGILSAFDIPSSTQIILNNHFDLKSKNETDISRNMVYIGWINAILKLVSFQLMVCQKIDLSE